MSKYGQPMSQTLAQMQMNELKMNDPKLNKIFDKLKKGDTVKIKHSSTLERGKDFIEYIVKSKNVVNKGRVEKITLARKDSPTSVKKFLYRRDGKVTFAVGDMAASIDDIREKYSLTNHEIIEEIEVEELDEGMAYKFAAVDKKGLVIGFASKESDAKDMARREKGRVVTLTKPLPDNKKSDMMINRPLPDGMDKFPTNTSATQGKRMEEVEEAIDPADLDLDATDADKKAADKNIIMQMRKAMDVRGNMPIEFANGKKEKVDPKILDMMTKAHMKIQKPRDKEKFVAMISKSKRDMLNVAKKIGSLKMGEELELEEKNKLKPNAKFDFQLFDDEDSPGSDKANADMNKEIHKAVRMKDKETARKHMMKVQNKYSKHGATDTEPREVINQILDAIFEMKEKFQSRRPSSKEVKMAIGIANDPRYKQGNYSGAVKAIEKIRDGLSDYPEVAAALKKANENLDEGKMKDLLIKAQDLMGPSKNREQGIEFVMKGLKVSKKEATKLVDAVIKMSEDLDEGKMKDLSMKIDSIVAKMKKDKQMKSFADKFKKDAMKSMDIKKSLEKVLPDYIAGKDIQALVKEEVELDEKWPPEELESPPEFGTTRKSSEGPAAMMRNKIGRNLYEPSVKAKLDRIHPLKLNDLAMQGNFKAFYNYVQKLNKDDQDVVIGAFGKAAKEFFGNKGVDYTKKLFKIKKLNMSEEVELDEKYDLYHKTFSDAMQHAYDYAKKKLGITVDPKEIDSKVATGPKKPAEGKTNKYRLKGKGGNLQIQVYNKGGSKPFELNMYKEENEMIKSLKDTILEMWTEASDKKDEGNAFGAALQAARENGDETFVVAGKTYKCEDYDENGEMKEFVQADGTKKRVKEGDNRLKANRTETNKNDKSDDGDGLDAVQPKAVKKKFKDRKDKDIDNDGDVDDSDKFLHKRRKAVSKAVKGESIERYHETKKGSLRDAVLQMWGEKHTPDHEEEKNEKKTLTKEKKNGTKNMTDTGKEVTPVETSVKMPKIKETNNKV